MGVMGVGLAGIECSSGSRWGWGQKLGARGTLAALVPEEFARSTRPGGVARVASGHPHRKKFRLSECPPSFKVYPHKELY